MREQNVHKRLEADPNVLVIENVAYRYERQICDALNKMAIEDVRKLVAEMQYEIEPSAAHYISPTRRQAAEALRRARRLPVGPDRNDLRQLAIGLLWLDKRGLASKALHQVRPDPRSSGSTSPTNQSRSSPV
jgi:hypothetical protein